MAEWINVKDQLPPLTDRDHTSATMLVYAEGIMTTAYYTTEVGWICDFSGVNADNVTHWMELPEGPDD